jgi:hypothetical protein
MEVTDMTYTTRYVCEAVDVPQQTLADWIQWGLLSPKGGGRRRPRKWSAKDVREASIIAGLRRAGITMQALREAWGFLRTVGHNPGSTGQFIALAAKNGRPTGLVKLCERGEALNLNREQRGQLLLIPVWQPTDQVIGDKKDAGTK